MKAGKTAADYRQGPVVQAPHPGYVPYPRHVTRASDGANVVVHNHEEEAAATGVGMLPDGTPMPVATEGDE